MGTLDQGLRFKPKGRSGEHKGGCGLSARDPEHSGEANTALHYNQLIHKQVNTKHLFSGDLMLYQEKIT